jgi:ubiquinone/menaquinone biosynthesis C-methylase UbiE
MSVERDVEGHYAHPTLIETIETALEASGLDKGTLTAAELAPVDEFHTGGRAATADLAAQLDLTPADRVLDVGCGLGGAARFVADTFGCAVTGIDLTADFVEAARTLSNWVGLGDRNAFEQASALDMPFGDGSFDAAYMLHGGMNSEPKSGLMAEVARVLAPGGRFGIYDIMRIGDGEPNYPVPWSENPSTSFLATPEDYRTALDAAGFDLLAERNQREWALEFFRTVRAKTASAGGPPPLGIHLVMGKTASAKVANMVEAITRGVVAPVQMIARKRR